MQVEAVAKSGATPKYQRELTSYRTKTAWLLEGSPMIRIRRFLANGVDARHSSSLYPFSTAFCATCDILYISSFMQGRILWPRDSENSSKSSGSLRPKSRSYLCKSATKSTTNGRQTWGKRLSHGSKRSTPYTSARPPIKKQVGRCQRDRI
jgi:hypothetical protein